MIRNLILMLITIALVLGCKEKVREIRGYEFNKEYALTKPFKTNRLEKDLTIDMYIKLNSYPISWTNIISKMDNDKSGEFSLRIQNRNVGQFYYGTGSRSIDLKWNPSEVLPLNKWVRLTIVRDIMKKELVLYANGKQITKKCSGKIQKAESSKNPLFINGTKQRNLNATFAEIRIWEKAISSSEIKKTYDIIKYPCTDKKLVGYFLFDDANRKEIKSLTSEQLILIIKNGK